MSHEPIAAPAAGPAAEAEPDLDSPDADIPVQRFDAREFVLRAAVGLVFVAVFSAPATWALATDTPSWLQCVVVYVSIALVAGIAFSVATVSYGRIKWGKAGISLGGGAAIGLASIWFVHRLLPPPAPLVLLQPVVGGSALVLDPPASLRVRRLQDSSEFLIEILRPGERHELEFLVVDAQGKRQIKKYAVKDGGSAAEVKREP